MTSGRQRCGWPGDDPSMVRYHDNEWGAAIHDDRKLITGIPSEG
jgi:DNA-3-methyladenine glycosylase I